MLIESTFGNITIMKRVQKPQVIVLGETISNVVILLLAYFLQKVNNGRPIS